MRLQLRLFLLLALLLTLTLAGSMWGLRVLTRDLSMALDQTAISVGQAVARVMETLEPAPVTDADGKTVNSERRVLVHRFEQEIKIAEGPANTTGHAHSPPTRVLRLQLESPAGDLRLHGAGADGHLIKVPRTGLSEALQRFTRQLWLGALVLLALGLLLAWWLARRIASPLQQLALAARELGQGHLGRTVAEAGVPEVRQSIAAFNRMSVQLQSLEAERRRLQDLAGLSELGEVGRGLAHGLRNPLNTIGLTLDALAEPDAAASALKQRAREQIRRIDEALKGFLALAAGGAAMSETHDLRELLQDLLCEGSQRSDGRVALQPVLPEQALPLAIQWQELRAALQAPLVNALEASPDGSTIELHLQPLADQRVRLEIADRGPGVDPAIRERLFSAHLSSKPEGAGMGLFLAARILKDRYDGQIALLDREGGGTLVRIEFGARRDG